MGSLGSYRKISVPQTCEHDGRPTCDLKRSSVKPTTSLLSERCVKSIKSVIFALIFGLKDTDTDPFIRQNAPDLVVQHL